ncbi:MAG: DUF427 domain-containing protein [Acidimicrobiia bacterium]|nr:DUF427 domain-containing protein [Acidimicrobiia bacterium]
MTDASTPPQTESVWDYPRPPKLDRDNRLVTVEFGGRTIARTSRALRVLETSHPPTFYVPIADIDRDVLSPTNRSTVCEFKGLASYWDVVVGETIAENAAWGYAAPRTGYEALTDHVAFYPGRMDRCTVGGEVVKAQPGDFYGGWITTEIEGPFKGGPGTLGW